MTTSGSRNRTCIRPLRLLEHHVPQPAAGLARQGWVLVALHPSLINRCISGHGFVSTSRSTQGWAQWQLSSGGPSSFFKARGGSGNSNPTLVSHQHTESIFSHVVSTMWLDWQSLFHTWQQDWHPKYHSFSYRKMNIDQQEMDFISETKRKNIHSSKLQHQFSSDVKNKI